jgi:hypothetical protein
MILEVLNTPDVTNDNFSELANGNKYAVTMIPVRNVVRSGVYWLVMDYI